MQELGLRIIEVNPGSERSGASVLHSVGEATQSARLPASAEPLLLVRFTPGLQGLVPLANRGSQLPCSVSLSG